MQINSHYKDKALAYLQRMNDMRFVGQAVFVVLVLLLSWSGVKSIQTNYGLQKQITALKQQNDLQKLQNDNQALKNQYLNSKQFLELAARQNFGLAAPGEKVVVVPASVAISYTIDLPGDAKAVTAKAKQPAYQRNFESWIDFFLHRQNGSN
jgi:cell division protein FtsB